MLTVAISGTAISSPMKPNSWSTATTPIATTAGWSLTVRATTSGWITLLSTWWATM